MDIYFDESRNTGEIGINGMNLNYFEQRYFILVGYINDELVTKEYEDFKKTYIRVINPSSKDNEIKGTDLLTRVNNAILDEFITKFISDDNLLITVYDKKFFIITSLLVWLFGMPFKDREPVLFYKYCEFLSKVDDQFLINFIHASNSKSINNIEKYIDYIVKYNFDECIDSSFENHIKNEFVSFIINFRKRGSEYIKMLQEDVILESIKIQGKNRNHIVNLTALGETLLLLKTTRDLSNKELNIYHDKIEIIEKYIAHYFDGIPINFLDSKNHLQIQLADNISSVIGKFINNTLPILSDRSIKKSLSNDNIWIRKRLSKIFTSVNPNNIKTVVNLREQAFLNTYCLTTINDFQDFKIKLFHNLNSKFMSELSNHLTLEQTYTYFKK